MIVLGRYKLLIFQMDTYIYFNSFESFLFLLCLCVWLN